MSKTLLSPEIDQQAIKALTAELKNIDPEIEKQFKRDLKSEFAPIASAIQGQLPGTSPLSGFNNLGRTKWAPARISVSVTPGSGWGRPFIAFNSGNAAGTKIVEFAGKGKRSYVKTAQGRALIRNLDDRAPSPNREGRFFFQAYKRNRTNVFERTQAIIDRYVAIFNDRVN